eukprot:8664447-Pyramimonas_sp.AAC.1
MSRPPGLLPSRRPALTPRQRKSTRSACTSEDLRSSPNLAPQDFAAASDLRAQSSFRRPWIS